MILLDTHVVVWLALDPGKISKTAKAAIQQSRDLGQGLAISDISLYEIAIMHRKSRVILNVSLETFLDEVEQRFVVLPIAGRVCVRTLSLPSAYPEDPADRIIGATALVEGLELVTADRQIRNSKTISVIW
ncbi:MAG TPA: type II toxin-antitoxin system VapC family toxin [Candidatus Sulfotelmatobacter sp.]|nr:type II toxin-antitoxin system VapC family toxin [Candidatus Sulfotelmatobacter sp.]